VNWQTKTILDLNLSFAGNQYRSLVTGGNAIIQIDSKILICDLKTFFNLNSEKNLAGRHLVLEGLSEFEDELSLKIGKKASWGYLLRLLHSVYNPETGFGNLEYKNYVINLLAAADLFFGIVLLNIQSLNPKTFQVSRQDIQVSAKAYNAIATAAKSLTEKLNTFSVKSGHETFKDFASSLESFFDEESQRVKWIDFGQSFCAFNNLPLELTKITHETLQNFTEVTFVDCMDEGLVNFFRIRLGLHEFKALEDKQNKESININLTTNHNSHQINIFDFPKDVSHGVVLVPSYKEIKLYYEQNYKQLSEAGTFLAEGYSGGVNKMFNNFSASHSSVLLVTPALVGKLARKGVVAEELRIISLPKSSKTEIYGLAVSEHMTGMLPNAKDLRDLLSLHKVVRCFFTPKLARISLYLEKNDEITQALLDYLKSMKINT
jgi:hypothetical protein